MAHGNVGCVACCVCRVARGARQMERALRGARARASAQLASPLVREVGGAPRNPAPRNHFLVWIVKPSGCHCTDAFGEKKSQSADPS